MFDKVDDAVDQVHSSENVIFELASVTIGRAALPSLKSLRYKSAGNAARCADT